MDGSDDSSHMLLDKDYKLMSSVVVYYCETTFVNRISRDQNGFLVDENGFLVTKMDFSLTKMDLS